VRCCDSVETEAGGCPVVKGVAGGIWSVGVLDEVEAEDGEGRNGGDPDGMCC
jgi:hypothetical protein